MIQKIFIVCVLCWAACILLREAVADEEDFSTAPAINGITQAAVSQGVLTCSSRINQISTFLAKEAISGALLFFPPKGQADRGTFSASMEIDPSNAPAMYATMTFSPVTNGCSASYDTVEYVNSSCPNVEKDVFKGSERAGFIKKNIIIRTVGNIKFFLMPAGSGCVIIKKEVIQ